MKMYDDSDYRLVKPIFNKIRRYPAMRILVSCVNKIRYAEESPHDRYGRYQPWTLLLLIKWVLLYGEPQGAYPPEEFGETQLNTLLNELWNLYGQVDGGAAPSRGEREWFLYFRKISFQQFPFQVLPYASIFARQSLLFGHLQTDDALRKRFLHLVGADIEVVLDLELAVLARFYQQRQPFVEEDWFRNMANNYPPGTIAAFLRELSKDFNSARAYLLNNRKEHAPVVQYELSEMSLLKRFPLFRDRGKYYCYSPSLLFRSLEHYIYDTLRHHDAQAFGNDFGKRVFEQYVGRAARHTRLPVVDENDLLTSLGQNGKNAY